MSQHEVFLVRVCIDTAVHAVEAGAPLIGQFNSCVHSWLSHL